MARHDRGVWLHLQASLSGRSKVVMLLTVSSSADAATDTLHSVTFASRLRGLELGPCNADTRSVHPAELPAGKENQGSGSGEKAAGEEECRRLQKQVAELQVRLAPATVWLFWLCFMHCFWAALRGPPTASVAHRVCRENSDCRAHGCELFTGEAGSQGP